MICLTAMDLIVVVTISFLGALLLLAVFYGWLKNRFSSQISKYELQVASDGVRLQERERTISELTENVARLDMSLQSAQESNASLQSRLSQLEERLRGEVEKIEVLKSVESRFQDAFKSLSLDALQNNSKSFLELAHSTFENLQTSSKGELEKRKQAIDELVIPLKESLNKVQTQLQEVDRGRSTAHASLTEQIKLLTQAQGELRGETSKLVQALKAPAVRGRWGEMQLKRAVEVAGMLEHCDFKQQESVEHEDSTGGKKRLRPDLVIYLPEGRSVVVDSKVPLQAYLEALEAPTEELRILKLKDHARQVRSHVTQLSQKSYWEQFSPAPEYVVLFLPGEMFYSAALEQDAELIEFGARHNVIPATPTTLIALLRAIAFGWKHQRLSENAAEISKLGAELYDRLATFSGHFSNLKRGLERAVGAYNDAAGSLESRVMVSARKLSELEATSSNRKELEVVKSVEHSPVTLNLPERLSSNHANASDEQDSEVNEDRSL